MIKMLRKMGLSSNMMYAAGFGSIALSVASWFTSKNVESAGLDRADRWGIFIGQWAPTFFALGTAMRLEEQWGEEGQEERQLMGQPAREAMPVS
ncbi:MULTISPECIES: hypothetical protein [Thermomonospora]|uniref:Uncharacterized protein n=1 Tax=Thermomonospora curvata (strain ATCC 19995 / DSM 43183 / JCM 3096 / KCTC 9072 / NBRC 15933 / NCIMB 10081 / Henssen B9) TaxID=471852 RepID=D1A3Q0_THECD|nr:MULTISPECIES: hypothetical protein [Thermomonospora]ACY97953.1 hypothetical protein Tcur_2388 [Thermomonospora curvata DSM 43183]PKK14232.1 MAG: hypothetical protein BUE48_011685 [Thermomonospora sp. CIF 1]